MSRSMRCWYTRWQISNALDRGDLGARMARGHVAGCASCQAFGHALASLHDRLSRAAHTAIAPPRAPRHTRWPLLAGPAALAAAAAVVLVIGTRGAPVDPVTDAPPSVQAPQAPESLERVRRVADRVTQVFANTPLETELDALLHDGKRGFEAVLATGGLR